MSEAPARRHDSDVALTAEARPAPRPRPSARAPRPSKAAPGAAGPLDRLRLRADRILRHPAGIVGGLLALGAVAAVAANALSFQTGRHPAPLFAKAPALPAPAPAGEAAPATTAKAEAPRSPGDTMPRSQGDAAPRTARPDGIGALIRGEDHGTASINPRAAPARAAAAKAAPAREASVKEAAGRETPGRIAPAAHAPAPVREAKAAEPPVKASALHAAPAPGAKPNETKPDKAVAYAQRALIKLGYGPLTVDGIAGPTTRAALARFERERRLPGASVARRTLQELEARSGLKPE